jgi:hypothetical protein
VIVQVNQRKMEKMKSLYDGMTQGVEDLFAAAPENELEAASNLLERMTKVSVADMLPRK